ncbi:MAG: glycosyltransferase family 4 protein [Bacteroidia bacterium]
MNANLQLLIIGSVWPEPNSSAAGTRMMQLIHYFKLHHFHIHFATAAADSEFKFPLNSIGVTTSQIKLNHPEFNSFIQELNPHVVLFDRYMTEEQFGWRLAEFCPNALRILDTEDLHFLRHARQLAFKNNGESIEAHLFSDLTKREIASIFRCDFTLIISKYEMHLLKNTFHIPEDLLLYLPIVFDTENIQNKTPFQKRNHFFFIGNFFHEPNIQAVYLLKEKIWPMIKKELPHAELHIYGAYLPPSIQQLHQNKTSFLVKGRAETTADVFNQHRVLLAPMPFGAGLKGKILESMYHSCALVTNSFGAEGIFETQNSPSFIQDSIEDFAMEAIKLYEDERYWEQAVSIGKNCLIKNFDEALFDKNLIEKTLNSLDSLGKIRTQNFIGEILKHELNQSKKYLSKWIELKNNLK